MEDERKLEEEEKQEWEEAKKTHEDENIESIPEEFVEIKDLEKFSKKGIISLAILALLLFVFGLLIGRRLLIMDEVNPNNYSYSSKKKEETKVENVDSDIDLDELIDKYGEKTDSDVPIVYARYKLEDANENNDQCAISFGKEGNFSFCLGSGDAYIYGNYHIDNGIITCNAITYRDATRQEPINSSFKLRILRREEVQITEVNIFDGNDGIDKQLIALNGLRNGYTYGFKK